VREKQNANAVLIQEIWELWLQWQPPVLVKFRVPEPPHTCCYTKAKAQSKKPTNPNIERKTLQMNSLNRGTKVVLAVLFLAMSVAAHAQAANAQDNDAPVCSSQSLKGAFGFQITGTNNFFGPFAFSGRFAADGNGNITSGTGTESVAGDVVSGVPFIGTYTVNADCTGKAVITFVRSDNQQQAGLNFTLVDDGHGILFMSSDQQTIETGTAQKIFGKSHKD
jgi:hypothetical protein